MTARAVSKSSGGVPAVRDVTTVLRHGEPSGRGPTQKRLISEIHTLHTMLRPLVKRLCFTPLLGDVFA